MGRMGMLIIISGPSGSGKGTVVKALDPSLYSLSISMTTRQPREKEIDGKDYFFTTLEEFNRMRENGELLEHAEFCGHCYGTPRRFVEEQIALGKAVVLEIEVNGALQVKNIFKDSVLIFLMPQTLTELKRRLKNRNTESDDKIEDRLRRSLYEIKLVEQYDYLVINDTVENSVRCINNIVAGEYLKPFRNMYHIEKFKDSAAELWRNVEV